MRSAWLPRWRAVRNAGEVVGGSRAFCHGARAHKNEEAKVSKPHRFG